MNSLKRYVDFVVIIMIFILGIFAGRFLFPKEIIKYEKIPASTPRIITEVKTNTIIKYVPKEINPQTGETENTDVEININKPEINVKLNNQSYTIIPDFNESQKFENGKLTFDQNSFFSLNLNLPKPERKVELGFYAGLDSLGGTLLIPKKDSGSYILMTGPHYDFKGWNLFFSTTW
jgi:hypothetical protein